MFVTRAGNFDRVVTAKTTAIHRSASEFRPRAVRDGVGCVVAGGLGQFDGAAVSDADVLAWPTDVVFAGGTRSRGSRDVRLGQRAGCGIR